jgi:hypothetical protein
MRTPAPPMRPSPPQRRVAEPMAPTPVIPSDDSGPVITLEPPHEAIEPVGFADVVDRRPVDPNAPGGPRGPRVTQRYGTINNAVDENEIDIPTFLRRQGQLPND